MKNMTQLEELDMNGNNFLKLPMDILKGMTGLKYLNFEMCIRDRLLTDRWKKPGDMVTMPRYDVPMQFDDRILEDASFLRLKNLSEMCIRDRIGHVH